MPACEEYKQTEDGIPEGIVKIENYIITICCDENSKITQYIVIFVDCHMDMVVLYRNRT